MTTLTVNLKPTINKDGTQTVRIRITKSRASKYISLFKINPKYYNAKKGLVSKSHHKSEEHNQKIQTTLNSINERIEGFEKLGVSYSISELINYKGDRRLLRYYIEAYKEELLSQDKYTAARKYTNLLAKLKAYDAEVIVSEIDELWMGKFSNFLKSNEKINSLQTVVRYVKFLKTVLRFSELDNQSVNKKALGFRITAPKSIKPKLTIDEIRAISSFENDRLMLTRDTFMLQFHTRGTRISDILKLHTRDINDNKLFFNESKNKKTKLVLISEQIKPIIERYAGHSKFGYVLPWMNLSVDHLDKVEYSKKIESKTAVINKELKLIAAHLKIEKRLTTHIARHSFAYTCLENGIDIGKISELLNHSDIRVTQEYLRNLTDEDILDGITESISNLI